MRSTVAAPAAKPNPADDRNIIDHVDGCRTRWTLRLRAYDRPVPRQANDAHVQKAAEEQAANNSDPDERGNGQVHSAAVYAVTVAPAKMLNMDSSNNTPVNSPLTPSRTAEPYTEVERSFSRSVEIMARLRAPGGCPWDREQTFDSIRRYTLEETYEVLDAIEKKDWICVKDELGDLLLQILFYAEMAEESGHFTLQDVIEGLNEKLIRRHPHVFAQRKNVENSEDVVATWEQIKKAERSERVTDADRSLLDEVPRGLPALMEASKLGKGAASVGFDWQAIEPVFAKLEEEIGELRRAISANFGSKADPWQEEELGDVLFTVTNLARKLGLEPELALRATNAKFRKRFRQMEISAGSDIGNLAAPELEALWSYAKSKERKEL